MNRPTSLTAKLICAAVVLTVGISRAAEQHIEYETETEKYTAWFDDSRISVAEMQRLVWLSPNLPPDLPGPFLMASSYQDDKVFIVPKLEDCSSNGEACGDVTNTVFLRNAELNLKHGTEQIEKLKEERVPTALEPVKAYLAQNMELYWNLEKARFLYAEKGSVKMFRQIFCEQCDCDAATALPEKLQPQSDSSRSVTSRAQSALAWYKQINHCQIERNKYPVSAWDQFKREFGIREELHHKHID